MGLRSAQLPTPPKPSLPRHSFYAILDARHASLLVSYYSPFNYSFSLPNSRWTISGPPRPQLAGPFRRAKMTP